MSFRINSPFKELPNPILWKHYDDEYGYLIVKDKEILDIGADVGTSADYWLQHGAKKIHAVEGDQESYIQLVKNIEEQGWKDVVSTEQMFICNLFQFEKLLIEHSNADIVKIDCEGCEKHWLDLDDKTISIPKVYIIEFHQPYLYERGINRLLKLGYIVENTVDVISGVCVVLFRKQNELSLFNSLYSKTKIIFRDICH